MASLNKVEIIGYLGADPEIKRMQNGNPIVNLRVGTSENWRDKQTGDRREKTEWHRVVIFNEQMAKVAEQYLQKGMQVYIQGKIATRKWQDQSGADRYSTEIVCQFDCKLLMLGKAGDNSGGERPAQQPQQSNGNGGREQHAYGSQPQQRPRTLAEEMDDDKIPF